MPVATAKMAESKFAKRLRKLRAERGWTQEHLARTADLTLAAVRKLERLSGKKAATPSWETAQKLARALGVSLDELAEDG
jgi:transcriptional regulator with XRE-family HTH domain